VALILVIKVARMARVLKVVVASVVMRLRRQRWRRQCGDGVIRSNSGGEGGNHDGTWMTVVNDDGWTIMTTMVASDASRC